MKKYRLTGTNILLERKKAETQTEGGILLPEQAQESPLQGTVKKIGPDVVIVQEGDEILFDRFAGVPIMLENTPYLILCEADILLIFES